MARSKLKVTGFARFFIFLIILAPMVYLGSAYYNGEDGIQNIKNFFTRKSTEEIVSSETPENDSETTTTEGAIEAEPKASVGSSTMVNAEIAKLRDELSSKDLKLNDLYQENAELKQKLEDQDKELIEVKAQLEKIKSAINLGE